MAAQMSAWQGRPRIDEAQARRIRESLQFFSHTTSVESLRLGGVDGSGDYPSFSYADSFVYVASATGTVFEADPTSGLRELSVVAEPNIEFVWLPEDTETARAAWFAAFESLVGRPPREVIERSDYRLLKATVVGRPQSTELLLNELLLPRSSDVSNVGIQLRSTAELGTALRLICAESQSDMIIMDTTMSLPMVTRSGASLFYEHVKRLCCVEARSRDCIFATLSKSHGLPAIDQFEVLAAQVAGHNGQVSPEHWYFRLPVADYDDWQLGLIEGRLLPPAGAVTYLFRTHRNVPVLRIDIERSVWEERFRDDIQAERQFFGRLDYAGHDQRAYGYPYPVKACHDRARLSHAERAALKKQIIEAAVLAGINPTAFRDVSTATGHS